MKNVLYCCLLCWLTLAFDVAGQSKQADYVVLPSASTIQWTGYYLFSFGEHTGTVGVVDGALSFDSHDVLTGSTTIDMHTVKDLDMPYDDGGKDVGEHLMSKDFFDADRYPQARIDIIKTEPITDTRSGGPNTNVTANLTIKGISHPVTFETLLTRTPTELKATGKFKFDRTRWGIEYNSGKIFAEVGDGAISDAVAIEFSLTAKSK